MDNSQLQIIKKVVPTTCPECNKEIFVGFQAMIPSLTSVVTKENMNEAKAEIKKRLDEITFKDPKKKENVIKWLDDENTFIDHTDVEDFLKELILEQSSENEDKNNK